jgi:hypothetical protein
MDLTKILKVGDRIYTPLFGYIEIMSINRSKKFSIMAYANGSGYVSFTSDGKPYESTPECLLFPSKDNRDWSTWKTEEKCSFKPFDKVLARKDANCFWFAEFFSNKCNHVFYCVGGNYNQCIPYNKETQHLIGTNQDCPDKYEIW